MELLLVKQTGNGSIFAENGNLCVERAGHHYTRFFEHPYHFRQEKDDVSQGRVSAPASSMPTETAFSLDEKNRAWINCSKASSNNAESPASRL